ncbi:MAG: PilT/PilU family type 4a pilus ATPase [Desulfobulbaceae bacterium]|nr:PilT/PilU family type 4a pilus ATPase [Desulfobulbaceae bacterium]
MIDKIFGVVQHHNATDIHLNVGLPPVVRIAGKLKTLQADPLTAEQTEEMMRTLTPPRCQVELSERGSTDFAFSHNENRYRIAAFRQLGMICIVMRSLRQVMFSVDELHIPHEVRDTILQGQGLFLVTGPTGSGKTTTIASLVDMMNKATRQHIITIEDPIEIIHEHKESIVTQREVGTDVASFSEGVHRALRQDPDVILIGEIRDPETTRIALNVAETGHLVMGTLHSRTIAATVTRVISQFPHDEQPFIRIQLSHALLGVINQILVPAKNEQGLSAVMEVMISNPAIRSLIHQGKENSLTDEIRKGCLSGMISFEEYLEHLCEIKWLSYTDALQHARDKKSFKVRMAQK